MLQETMVVHHLIRTDMVNTIFKILKPLDSVWGWVCALATFFISFLGDGVNLLLAMLVLVLMDAVFGTWVSIVQGKGFESRRLRETAAKFLVYFGLQIAAIILDKVLTTDLVCMRATTALIVVCETWSVLANITIIYPNFIIGKLLKKYLSSEMANKLGMEKEEVERIMDENGKTE